MKLRHQWHTDYDVLVLRGGQIDIDATKAVIADPHIGLYRLNRDVQLYAAEVAENLWLDLIDLGDHPGNPNDYHVCAMRGILESDWGSEGYLADSGMLTAAVREAVELQKTKSELQMLRSETVAGIVRDAKVSAINEISLWNAWTLYGIVIGVLGCVLFWRIVECLR